jgi:hypothetical protein
MDFSFDELMQSLQRLVASDKSKSSTHGSSTITSRTIIFEEKPIDRSRPNKSNAVVSCKKTLKRVSFYVDYQPSDTIANVLKNPNPSVEVQEAVTRTVIYARNAARHARNAARHAKYVRNMVILENALR